MKFANGAIGSVFASLCVNDGHSYPSRLIIHYANGTIFKQQIKEPSVGRSNNFKAVGMTLNCVCNGQYIEEKFIFSPENRSGAYQWKNLYDAVRNKQSLPGEVSPEAIAAGIAVIRAMARAEKSSVSEKVNKSLMTEIV
jgi:predicted dehydrogenase